MGYKCTFNVLHKHLTHSKLQKLIQKNGVHAVFKSSNFDN